MWNTEKKFDFMSRNRGGRGGGKEERKKENERGLLFLGVPTSRYLESPIPSFVEKVFLKTLDWFRIIASPLFLCVFFCVCVVVFEDFWGAEAE